MFVSYQYVRICVCLRSVSICMVIIYVLYIYIYIYIYNGSTPVTVAERSKACTIFARSEADIVGSNPSQGMDV
jgi:hypothetical protein